MNKLWVQLSISVVLLTLLVVGVVAFLTSAGLQNTFTLYVTRSNVARIGPDFVATLEAYHAQQGSWQGVQALLPGAYREGAGQGRGRGGAQTFIADADGQVVAATAGQWVGRAMAEIDPKRTIELKQAGQVVGYLGEQTPGTLLLNQAEARFDQEIVTMLLVVALVGGLLAFGVGLGLAWRLTRPLRQLTDQLCALTATDLGRPVVVRGGTDELQRLAHTFNQLSQRLSEADQARQRMAADVAHELRTPITVLRGHLEAMMDGIYPMDSAHLGVAYDQALHLSRLVEDLRLLTTAEAGRLSLNKRAVHLGALLSRAVQRFRPLADDANLSLRLDALAEAPVITADEDRLQQVIDNLLTNAVRHTPPGGEIALRLDLETPHRLRVAVSNTGTPLTAEQAAHVFDRFWRADEARERDKGGSGLGLAITRQLLRLHGGEIWAVPSLGRTVFVFTLPVPSAPLGSPLGGTSSALLDSRQG
jgi:two-component system OmpR family sensor kinase/two-component system sensor histidine kinase BaeS